MAALMRSADFMIGKPGGLTSSECLVAGCPLVVYSPFMIPGQEEENARSLVDNGAGVVADNIQDLGIVVKRLLESPTERESLRQNALALSKPNATAEIIQAIRER
ncbi:MAG: glycosyltransferase, partial [Armatimonadetes bacterium]|nr:glycosyltransferase [Armatimonadota bacterium]